MKEQSNERVAKVVGIDLAQRSFHGYGVDERGPRVISKTFTRTRLREFMAHLPACTVAMEACGSAHYWARQFRSHGHEVRLIAPQLVKPYVKSNKNDTIDAEAICEAAQRPTMRFVAIKRVEPQDIQATHRMRRLVVERRTAPVNQIRGRLLEYGIEIPPGRAAVGQHLPRTPTTVSVTASGRNGGNWPRHGATGTNGSPMTIARSRRSPRAIPRRRR